MKLFGGNTSLIPVQLGSPKTPQCFLYTHSTGFDRCNQFRRISLCYVGHIIDFVLSAGEFSLLSLVLCRSRISCQLRNC